MTMETPTSELRPDVDQMIHMVRLWYNSESLAFNKADTCGKGGVVHVICRSSRCFRCCMMLYVNCITPPDMFKLV